MSSKVLGTSCFLLLGPHIILILNVPFFFLAYCLLHNIDKPKFMEWFVKILQNDDKVLCESDGKGNGKIGKKVKVILFFHNFSFNF